MRHKLSGLRRPQGAALIAVMLLTMVLSAIGIVAMQNTFNSLQLSGNYRLRRQAQETSDAALTFVSVRAGDRPVNYMRRLQTSQQLDFNGSTTPEERLRSIERGGHDVLTREDFVSSSSTLDVTSAPSESGFFNGAASGQESHESDPGVGRVDFAVIIRDPSEGPPPPGSDGAFCLKAVYVGSRATYDALETGASGEQLPQNWARPPRAASGMVGMEAWIGPVPCRGGGSR